MNMGPNPTSICNQPAAFKGPPVGELGNEGGTGGAAGGAKLPICEALM